MVCFLFTADDLMTSSDFFERCYALLKTTPVGKVTTYRAIAHALNTKAYRAVGQAMSQNKNLITVPCHRVVRSNGDVGLFALGREKKIALLKDEGVDVVEGRVQRFDDVLFTFGVEN